MRTPVGTRLESTPPLASNRQWAAVTTVVAVRRPAGPGAPRYGDLVEDEPFGGQRRGQGVDDLTVGGAAAAHLAAHLVGPDGLVALLRAEGYRVERFYPPPVNRF